eukprot:m51a1_g10406 hypothetical protein (163) ;mRNA; f:16426-19115
MPRTSKLDHNHHIISILFIHVMKHYNFQLPAISDVMAASSSFWRMLCLIPIHITIYHSMMLVPLIMYFSKAINEITMAAHHETWIDQLIRIAHLRSCLNVFVMLRTEGDSIFNNIDDFRFVTHQKLIEVDISKANGKTIVPVIHKHIKKVALRWQFLMWYLE